LSGALVVDASVAIKWVLREQDSELADNVVAFEVRAPDWLLIECGSAVWRHVRLGEIGPRQARASLEIIREMPMELTRSIDLVDRAFDLALDLRHPIYDCLYLVLAIDAGAQMVTADRRFVDAVRARSDLGDWVVLLTELAQ
jgi:predicted nucleic acid-binding protein